VDFSIGQDVMKTQIESLEKGQEYLTIDMVEVKSGLKDDVKSSQKELSSRMENLESGQKEIKELIKHTTTLMIESFT
jgi:hypothetical protein